MKPNRQKLIRLAYHRPELRESLMPLLKEAAGMVVTLDVVDFPGTGTTYTVLDSGTRSDHGGKSEFLHAVESSDGSEGHLILQGEPLSRGDKVVVERTMGRPRGTDYVGEARIRLR